MSGRTLNVNFQRKLPTKFWASWKLAGTDSFFRRQSSHCHLREEGPQRCFDSGSPQRQDPISGTWLFWRSNCHLLPEASYGSSTVEWMEVKMRNQSDHFLVVMLIISCAQRSLYFKSCKNSTCMHDALLGGHHVPVPCTLQGVSGLNKKGSDLLYSKVPWEYEHSF